MYRICVSNIISKKKRFLSTSFIKRYTTYKTCLVKRDLNAISNLKKDNKKDGKSNKYLSALHFKYSTHADVLITYLLLDLKKSILI